MINWKKINKKDLPDGEVLAANFKKYTYGYLEKVIGHLDCEVDMIVCENEYEILENCTHYVDINEYDIV